MAFYFQQDGTSFGCILVAGLVILVLAFVYWENEKKRKRLAEANAAYQELLAALRTNPHDPKLRQKTLEAGRYYSNLTRNQKGVTTYDEVALSNDIGAACAAATAPAPAPPPKTPLGPSIEDRLRQLQELLDRSLITEDEYSMRREKILDEV